MNKWVFVIAALFVFGLTACDMGSEPEESDGNGDVTFSEDVQPIFTDNCAFSGCHGTSNTQQNLVLTEGEAYGNIVDVASEERPDLDRVEPGAPDSSFLYLKLQENPPARARMPLNGPYLSEGQIETIGTWIEEGAENN